uniref:Uncharacterized protein n=1 Tax=Vitrella brassicaformis TaxID=1169539 RepID=A0A7S1K296_9ALVE|mmetsp:Transcript_35245/g.87517  ORF Transcript_35245/g.87517 Transcript_35245/m.87517 type:complete len:106 (+) Transcript_35245:1156-1473(+)
MLGACTFVPLFTPHPALHTPLSLCVSFCLIDFIGTCRASMGHLLFPSRLTGFPFIQYTYARDVFHHAKTAGGRLIGTAASLPVDVRVCLLEGSFAGMCVSLRALV